MKTKLLALLMGTSLVLAACAGGDEAGDDKEPATNGGGDTATVNAEEIFQKSCVSCHGQNLEGGAGPKLSDVGSRLSKEEIETVIAEGRGAMPKGLLQGEEASAVAEWLAAKK